MELREVSFQQYTDLFQSLFYGDVAYNSAAFNSLNASKADDVKAIAVYGDSGEPIARQIFGLRDGMIWNAPFSAPFSCLETKDFLDKDTINHIYRLLADYLASPVKLVWPSPLYKSPLPPDGKSVIYDFNYHYPLERFNNFEAFLSRAGRYSHHRAQKHPFAFFKTDDIQRAYHIISENRKAMGYPLAMTMEQVEKTIKIIPADFFVMTLGQEDVAAAMIYRSAPGVAQVIYWGDLPHARHARPMNHLAWRVFEWYATNCPQINSVDIGPASSEGIRNEGLIQFKLAIGCVETLRPTILL